MKYTRNHLRNRSRHRRISSCCRHTAIFITRPDAGRLYGRWGTSGGVKNKKDQLRMLDSSTFRRSLVALALCSTAFAFSATPAAARSHHGSRRFAHAHDTGHHARRHFATHRIRHLARRSRWDASVAALRTPRLRNAYASVGPDEYLRRRGDAGWIRFIRFIRPGQLKRAITSAAIRPVVPACGARAS